MMLSARQGCGTAEASVGHMLMAMASDAGARPGTDAVFYDAYVEPANLTDDELTELWEAGTVFEKGSRTVTTSAWLDTVAPLSKGAGHHKATGGYEAGVRCSWVPRQVQPGADGALVRRDR